MPALFGVQGTGENFLLLFIKNKVLECHQELKILGVSKKEVFTGRFLLFPYFLQRDY